MSDELDLGEAATYILGERPDLDEAHVWAVLTEIVAPPAAGADELAGDLIAQTHPEVSRGDVRAILGEWRTYAALAGERDWDDDELDHLDRFDDD
jgi:hypothetical protein